MMWYSSVRKEKRGRFGNVLFFLSYIPIDGTNLAPTLT